MSATFLSTPPPALAFPAAAEPVIRLLRRLVPGPAGCRCRRRRGVCVRGRGRSASGPRRWDLPTPRSRRSAPYLRGRAVPLEALLVRAGLCRVPARIFEAQGAPVAEQEIVHFPVHGRGGGLRYERRRQLNQQQGNDRVGEDRQLDPSHAALRQDQRKVVPLGGYLRCLAPRHDQAELEDRDGLVV